MTLILTEQERAERIREINRKACRKYYQAHKVEAKARVKAWANAHKEHVTVYKKAYDQKVKQET